MVIFSCDFVIFPCYYFPRFPYQSQWIAVDRQKSNFPWISAPRNVVFEHLKPVPKRALTGIPAERRKRRRGEAPEPFPSFGRDRFKLLLLPSPSKRCLSDPSRSISVIGKSSSAPKKDTPHRKRTQIAKFLYIPPVP